MDDAGKTNGSLQAQEISASRRPVIMMTPRAIYIDCSTDAALLVEQLRGDLAGELDENPVR